MDPYSDCTVLRGDGLSPRCRSYVDGFLIYVDGFLIISLSKATVPAAIVVKIKEPLGQHLSGASHEFCKQSKVVHFGISDLCGRPFGDSHFLQDKIVAAAVVVKKSHC